MREIQIGNKQIYRMEDTDLQNGKIQIYRWERYTDTDIQNGKIQIYRWEDTDLQIGKM